MKWPWVSRLAYDTIAADRDRLREENARLLEHVTRMDRIEHGVGETPRQPRAPIEPIPKDLYEHIQKFSTASMRKFLEDTCQRRRRAGQPWDRIQRDIMANQLDDAEPADHA